MDKGRVLGLDVLSPGDKQELTALIQDTKQKGILVGALSVVGPQRLSALLLDAGVTYLLRMVPAKSKTAPEIWNLKRTYQELPNLKYGSTLHSFGQSEKGFWQRRKFYSELAYDTLRKQKLGGIGQYYQLCSDLLGFLSKYHARGLVHGHIAGCNLALQPDSQGVLKFELLDNACLINDSERLGELIKSADARELAPELSLTQERTAALDIYGLGLVMRESFSFFEQDWSKLDAVCRRLIENCAQTEARARPKLSELIDAIGVVSGDRNQQGPRLLKAGAQELQSGRVIKAKEQSPIITPPVERANEAAAKKSRSLLTSRDWQALILLVCTLVLLYLVLRPFDFDQEIESVDIKSYWTSSQPSLMSKVALQALQSDSEARSTIVSDALEGNQRPQAKLELIRLAYNPLWENDLSELDRRAILSLSLAALLDNTELKAPDFSKLHPGVVYAVAASVDPTREFAELRSVKAAHLQSLPDHYGAAFAILGKQSNLSMADAASLALAHLLNGDSSVACIQALFPANAEFSQITARLEALLLSMQPFPSKLEEVYRELTKSAGVISKALGWFEEGSKAGWSKVAPKPKLEVLLGRVANDLALEQYIDLLKFPAKQIREAAKTHLSKFLKPASKSVLTVLSSDLNQLTREQHLALLSALNTKSEVGDALIGAWFKSNPDPATVVALLLARAALTEPDTFNLEAARYISSSQYSPSLFELTALSSHREQLARAYAIARLDPNKADERKVLEAMATVEPSKLLREQIMQRLKSLESNS